MGHMFGEEQNCVSSSFVGSFRDFLAHAGTILEVVAVP